MGNTPKPIRMAISKMVPEIGKRYVCLEVEYRYDRPMTVKLDTSPVEEFVYVGNNIYKVVTRNSIYIVKVAPVEFD